MIAELSGQALHARLLGFIHPKQENIWNFPAKYLKLSTGL